MTDTTAAAYTCPMHPDVISTEPGTCPQCGMKLVPAPNSYVCPMHPDVVSTEPGTCPQCGMKLVPAPTSYVCPMHPDVTSDDCGHMPEMRDAARPIERHDERRCPRRRAAP